MTPGQPCRVVFSGEVRELLQALVADAAAAGISARVRRALSEIEGRLELTPGTWGDPVRRFEHLRVTEFRRVFDELAVRYSVHDSEPLVWLTGIVPVLNHPLRPRDDRA